MTPAQIRANQALCKHVFDGSNLTRESKCLNGCWITVSETKDYDYLRKEGIL